MRLIILLARLLNLGYYYFRSVLEKLGVETDWSRETGEYFGLSAGKAEKIYQKKRAEAATLWSRKKRVKERQIQSFYQETDYFVFRQTYFHRLKIYLDLAIPLLLRRHGRFCEYGGGVGPFTHWLLKLFPGWRFTIADLDCPVLDFSKWRFKNNPRVDCKIVTPSKLPLEEKYEVITCKQVLEHVSRPLKVVRHLVDHLSPGGWLFLDYVNNPGRENLVKSAKERRLVLGFLDSQLRPIFKISPESRHEGYGLYIKKS